MTAVALTGRRVRLEQKAFWRNPEAAFFTFILPVVLVVVEGFMNHGDHLRDGTRTVVMLVPGILAFGLIATNYGNLAATIAILRDQGVLKRIRATPLPPWVFLAGQIGSSLLVSLLMTIVVVTTGTLLFGVHLPPARVPALLAVVAVGSACFCALGLALSGFIRHAQSAGAITNASYIPLSLVSGVFFPFQHRPGWLLRATGLFPVGRLADALRAPFLGKSVSAAGLLLMGAWAVLGAAVAARCFRWTKAAA